MLRIGVGYDVHAFAVGRRLVLGGVTIPGETGLTGHSDADVLLHAIMDALLGSAGLGDIGQHFPPQDPTYKDANSLELLTTVGKMLAQHGCRVHNIDATVIAERPRLAPYIEFMRQCIAKALALEIGQISIKATTNEGLGDIGRGEGIACLAVALVYQGEKTKSF